MTEPPRPDPSLIEDYLNRWSNLENYVLQEESLAVLFGQLCPHNTRVQDVLLKVSALNDFYSTNIYDTFSVAKHILGLGIDLRLQVGDYTLVNAIATISIRNKSKNFYSFASKYCSHHRPDRYPIFDSFVEKMMVYYRNKDAFADFSKGDLKDYPKFISVIETFRRAYGLEAFSLNQIDVFLWMVGKECFPRKYYRPRSRLGAALPGVASA